jgi:hypothetical protein
MRQGARSVLILMAAVTLLATPAAASAKKKHKKPKSPPVSVVTNTQTTTTANQLITVTASCPPGLLAVGGGFVAGPPTVTGTSVDGVYFVYESRRVSESSWRVSAIRQETGGPLPLTTSVDCRSTKLPAKKKPKKKKKRKLTITEATATGSATTNTEGSATASCPANTQALGGGFSSSPDPSLSGSSSFPFFEKSYRTAPGAWTSTFFSIGTPVRTVTSYAYCANGLNVVDSVGTATLPGSTGTTIAGATAVSPACPPRRALLGGGFNNPSIAPMSAVAIINTSRAVGGTWQVTALNDSNSAGTIESHGYCA